MNIYNEDTLQAKGIKYLKGKYGDDVVFSVNQVYKEPQQYNMYITVEGQEDWDVRLTWNFDEESFKDNYMSWVFQEEIEQTFYEIFLQVYKECKLYNSPYGGQELNIYTKDTTLDEYLQTALGSDISLFILGTPENSDQETEKVQQLFIEKNWNIHLYIYYVSQNVYDQLKQESLKEDANRLLYAPFQKQYYLRGSFLLDNKKIEMGSWIEGKTQQP